MTPAIRQRGDVLTPPDPTMTMCHPSKPARRCVSCARCRLTRERDAEQRHSVVIDGSVLKNDGGCLMFAPVLCSAECREAA